MWAILLNTWRLGFFAKNYSTDFFGENVSISGPIFVICKSISTVGISRFDLQSVLILFIVEKHLSTNIRKREHSH